MGIIFGIKGRYIFIVRIVEKLVVYIFLAGDIFVSLKTFS